ISDTQCLDHILTLIIIQFIYCSIYFFFFQAEDGIRDGHVTGVQTCALPIFQDLDARIVLTVERSHIGRAPCRLSRLRRAKPETRSEERRVGKECRSRWSPDQ